MFLVKRGNHEKHLKMLKKGGGKRNGLKRIKVIRGKLKGRRMGMREMRKSYSKVIEVK